LAVAHYQFLSLDLKAHKDAGAVIIRCEGDVGEWTNGWKIVK
jgi:hypothetical protein